MPDLLIELFSEEIPAGMQPRASADLERLVTDGLTEAGLTFKAAQHFATPRRLALSVTGLLAQSPTVTEERKGPKVGAPDKAIEGFLRGAGVAKEDLEIRADKKGEVYFAQITKPGRPAAEIVAEVLEKTIRSFPWPKSMRWGEGTLRWVRPLQSILCVLDGAVVPLTVDQFEAGNTTGGHRFMAPARFPVTSFADYEEKLLAAHVILRPEARADAIWKAATAQAEALGLEVVEDRGLLAEVAGLVEWPVVLMGHIGEAFLSLPPEVLQTSMKEHQKFFSVRNPATGKIEKFITVADRETADGGATILAGNQKVLAARLSDAKFFWENDLRVARAGMGDWLEKLKAVTFHAKLGTQAERIARIAALARDLAPVVGADPDQAEEAAKIAKADLASEMIYEFPELQGIMGRYYALEAGHPEPVANAARDHYAPLGPSDAVPTEPVSVAVSLAEKLDILTGFWAIDEKPTGSKDPYALRRASLGILRLCDETGLRPKVSEMLAKAVFSLLLTLCQRENHGFSKLPELWSPEDGETEPPQLWRERPYSIFATPTETFDEPSLLWKLSGFAGADFDDEKDVAALEHAKNTYDSFISRLRLIDTLGAAAGFTRAAGKSPLTELFPLDSYELCWRPAFEEIRPDFLAFFHDRLKVYLRDRGIRHDVIDACLAMPGNDDLTLLVKRATALQEVMDTEDGQNLVQGFKRANNLLAQAEEKDGVEYSYGADLKYAEAEEERALFNALEAAEAKIKPAMNAEDFVTAMAAMAELRAPIDAFFEAVKINAESEVIRRNRLNLLSQIRGTVGQIADLTRVEG
ncbi:MAG: glycine--tRNA ligase subunit beta [Pseudomonadota bacterium]